MSYIANTVTTTDLSDEYFNKFGAIELKDKYSITNLKSSPNVQPLIFITDVGKEGWFLYDSTDTTSTGDDINIIVTSSNKRYKKKSIFLTEYNNILLRLNNLEYVPQTITSFTNNKSVNEKGDNVSSVVFSYGFNKTPTTSSINNGVGNVTGTSKTATVNLTTDTTYILTASDSTTTVTASTSVTFMNKIYWGTNANTSLNNSAVLALTNNTLSTAKNRTIVLNGSGQYVYYCYPASMGDATFTVNGLVSTAWTKTTQDVTNAFNNVTSYNIYRTNTLQNGTGINISIS